MSHTARPLLVGAILSAALLAGACGTDAEPSRAATGPASASASAPSTPAAAEEPSVRELYAKVRAAALAAKSGRIVGSVTTEGGTVTVDIEGLADGSNQKAEIGVGDGTAQILTVGGKYYMSGDAAFWTEQTGEAQAAKQLAGKYVEISEADAKEIGDLSLGSILRETFEDEELSRLETLTTSVQTRTEGGAKVWVASDPSGAEFWVDPESENLLKIVITGTEPGELTFDSWNAAATVAAPPASKIVTL
ncbi:MAG: hypothetical protein ACRCSN_20690 [Dermatophilaceae bacterium]